MPALACLVCPACLTTYAKALGTVGLGVVMSEAQHVAFLVIAVLVALGSSVHSLRLTRHLGPFVATAAGCTVLVAEHAVGGSHAASP